MKIYFAGSIRGGRDDRKKYFELIEFLSTHAEVLTEHVGLESLGKNGEGELHDEAIYQRDLEWLSSADAVVALSDGAKPSPRGLAALLSGDSSSSRLTDVLDQVGLISLIVSDPVAASDP